MAVIEARRVKKKDFVVHSFIEMWDDFRSSWIRI
jgi:hypothetical protein